MEKKKIWWHISSIMQREEKSKQIREINEKLHPPFLKERWPSLPTTEINNTVIFAYVYKRLLLIGH